MATRGMDYVTCSIEVVEKENWTSSRRLIFDIRVRDMEGRGNYTRKCDDDSRVETAIIATTVIAVVMRTAV